ncbi:hypothetical protein AB0K71_00475 [Streptomyces syringium]|uniref:hypothetical protein n=1 Tax=Streptomyces syringium TaxID=76729 RepID=UPI0033C02356
MSALKLFHAQGGVAEVTSRPAEAETDVQDLVEADLEAMLGVRFPASDRCHCRQPGEGPPGGGR